MGDENEIKELKDLVAQQARDTAKLIAELARARGPGGPADMVPNAADAAVRAIVIARADKISKLGVSWCHSEKVSK